MNCILYCRHRVGGPGGSHCHRRERAAGSSSCYWSCCQETGAAEAQDQTQGQIIHTKPGNLSTGSQSECTLHVLTTWMMAAPHTSPCFSISQSKSMSGHQHILIVDQPCWVYIYRDLHCDMVTLLTAAFLFLWTGGWWKFELWGADSWSSQVHCSCYQCSRQSCFSSTERAGGSGEGTTEFTLRYDYRMHTANNILNTHRKLFEYVLHWTNPQTWLYSNILLTITTLKYLKTAPFPPPSLNIPGSINM